jgi:hypothetical protein
VVHIVTTVLEEVNEILPGTKSTDGQIGSLRYPAVTSRCAPDTNVGRSFNAVRKVDSPWDGSGARYVVCSPVNYSHGIKYNLAHPVVRYSRLKRNRVVHKSFPQVKHF